MARTDFKIPIGTRVSVMKDFDGAKVGMIGTVVVNKGGWHDCHGIEFDEPFMGGHSLDGRLKNDLGQWVPPDHLSPLGVCDPDIELSPSEFL